MGLKKRIMESLFVADFVCSFVLWGCRMLVGFFLSCVLMMIVVMVLLGTLLGLDFLINLVL